jgi:hypothetical protein
MREKFQGVIGTLNSNVLLVENIIILVGYIGVLPQKD